MPENCCLILDTIERSERGRTGETCPSFLLAVTIHGAVALRFLREFRQTMKKHRTNSLTMVMTILTFIPNLSSFYVNGVEAWIRWQRTIGIS
jgi:nitrate reductase gamma subunit